MYPFVNPRSCCYTCAARGLRGRGLVFSSLAQIVAAVTELVDDERIDRKTKKAMHVESPSCQTVRGVCVAFAEQFETLSQHVPTTIYSTLHMSAAATAIESSFCFGSAATMHGELHNWVMLGWSG